MGSNMYVDIAREWLADSNSVSYQKLKHYADGAKASYERAYELAKDPIDDREEVRLWKKADDAFLTLNDANAAVKAAAYTEELNSLIKQHRSFK